MKKIAVFQRDLGVGGIQRSLLNLLKRIDGLYEIDLFLFKKPAKGLLDGLKTVRVTVLGSIPYLTRIVDISLLEKTYVFGLPDKRYDAAIDFSSYSNECALCVRQAKADKKILWIHNDLETEYKENIKYRVLFRAFRKKYTYYDSFAAVSEGIKEPFRRMSGRSDAKISVVPNIIDTRRIFTEADKDVGFRPDGDKTNVIFVGRLTHQKGVDLLLDSFARAVKKRGDLRLYIVGDGDKRKDLEAQAARLGLREKAIFLGEKTDPFPYMACCDALALTSRYEGQGMVLLEAKALGLDLIFPRPLEKYTPGLVGTDDVAEALAKQRKKPVKTRDDLESYNESAIRAFEELI